ncbi:DUF4174 domain-containing protein [Phaeobacter sp. HF9A]|uniref:DUF4174 domain-containing protein n=1 Tax=Phaeobacter sp. HF9A TaxID=2721561 RepID=UPI001431DDB3|nr:DUF4174 domain-containing protein [Phaeobacter sp. HF9A]NIZ14989.1 DUF4174 domain-containing protein [Phaeobacter sp. HF9A]
MTSIIRLTLAALMALTSAPLLAQEIAPGAPLQTLPPEPAADPLPAVVINDGYDIDLDAYRWTHRPVVVFADSPADPRYHEQIRELMQDPEALARRDVIVFVDTDPSARSALRKKLRPRGFMLVLIGKDGGVKLRKPLPWSVREISRSIDKTPTRLQEVEERRSAPGN